MKREIPEIWEDVSQIKFIGPYLTRALQAEGIYTCEDLVDKLEDFGDIDNNPAQMRRTVKAWLEDVLVNARALGCCYPRSRIIEGEECAYRARYANQNGFNALVTVMRYYAERPWRNWVPRTYRGLSERNKYPRACNLEG